MQRVFCHYCSLVASSDHASRWRHLHSKSNQSTPRPMICDLRCHLRSHRLNNGQTHQNEIVFPPQSQERVQKPTSNLNNSPVPHYFQPLIRVLFCLPSNIFRVLSKSVAYNPLSLSEGPNRWRVETCGERSRLSKNEQFSFVKFPRPLIFTKFCRSTFLLGSYSWKLLDVRYLGFFLVLLHSGCSSRDAIPDLESCT